MQKILILLFSLLIGITSFAEEYYLGDIEGMMNQFNTLIERGIIRIVGNHIEFTNPEDSITFVGDLQRRGPDGIKILTLFRETHRINPKQIKAVIGNHDVNGISFVVYSVAIDEGLIPDYLKWATENKIQDNKLYSQENKLWWWMHKFGLQDKVASYWIEKAIEKSNKTPKDFYTEGKVDFKKLALIVPNNDLAESFFKFHAPGGEAFEYLRTNTEPMHQSEDAKVLTFHSGQPTEANFGKISGVGLIDINSPETMREWNEATSKFKHDHLNLITGYLSDYFSLKKEKKQNDAVKLKLKDLAQKLFDNRFRTWGDAGWDHSKNSFAIDADSFIYPDKRVFSDTSLPGIPSAATIHKIVLAGIEVIVGGHFPVGDGPIGRIAIDKITGKRVLFLTIDSSYSALEGNAVIKRDKDGTFKVESKTRAGMRYVLEYPTAEKLEKMINSTNEAEQKKGKALARYGYAVDGYMILGNVVQNINGTDVVDYDKFIIARQDGYNFTYKEIDIYGINDAERLGKYGVPEVDFRKMRENAREAQKQMLVTYNKNDISKKELFEKLKGKSIHIISGPSESSFEPLKRTNESAVKSFLADFESRIRAYGANEKVVFLGGGTKGLESAMLEVVDKVNAERTKNGQTQFETMGFITGMTFDRDLDSSKSYSGEDIIKDYYRLEAFYWDDYIAELYKLLASVHKKNKLNKIVAEFGGGGGILVKQILRDTLPMLKIFKNVFKIILNVGLNTINPDGTVKSGTDKSLEQINGGKEYLNTLEHNIPKITDEIKSQIEVRDTSKVVSQPKFYKPAVKKQTPKNAIILCRKLLQ